MNNILYFTENELKKALYHLLFDVRTKEGAHHDTITNGIAFFIAEQTRLQNECKLPPEEKTKLEKINVKYNLDMTGKKLIFTDYELYNTLYDMVFDYDHYYTRPTAYLEEVKDFIEDKIKRDKEGVPYQVDETKLYNQNENPFREREK